MMKKTQYKRISRSIEKYELGEGLYSLGVGQYSDVNIYISSTAIGRTLACSMDKARTPPCSTLT